MIETDALDPAAVFSETDGCATCATHRAAIRAALSRKDVRATNTQQRALDAHVQRTHVH